MLTEIISESNAPGPLQHLDDLAAPQHLFAAAVQVNDVHIIRPQAPQAAVDALLQQLRIPVRQIEAAGMAALGEQIIVAAPMRHRLADQLLAVRVAFGGIDDVQPRIEGVVQQPLNLAGRRPFESDFGPAEPENAYIQACFPVNPLFHIRFPSLSVACLHYRTDLARLPSDSGIILQKTARPGTTIFFRKPCNQKRAESSNLWNFFCFRRSSDRFTIRA
jgi:hypothetical protein